MKKFLGIILSSLLIICVIPFSAYAMDNQDDIANTSIIQINEASEIHEIVGYSLEWNESFEDGIPTDWENTDKDGDGYSWWLLNEEPTYEGYNYAHHGNNAIHSNSKLRYNGDELNPDNWLILPEQTLSENKKYILTFDTATFDAIHKNDFIGIFISTDGGTTFTQLGEDINQRATWQEVSVDLTDYSGKKVKIAIVHHNSYNQNMVLLDCFNLWSKQSTTPVISESEKSDNNDNKQINQNDSEAKSTTVQERKSTTNNSAQSKKSPETGNSLSYAIIIFIAGLSILLLSISKRKIFNIN